ncbi:hypothetical protein KPL70_018566 [Citrus sinensis]|uniref:uncharacterized protein LOC102631480 isoform X3 n=1 Tax=Citrus sinensis TaxID=2711 RepID=UPI0021A02116|nr:uncharacterized protein LOC102631480 isoform X3 [Citrus sinensis]KAH9674702.1 hypothetical protein KPL70_018566 [Citrus sinensis]
MNWNAPINSWWRSHVTLRTLYLLFLGQLVSFTLALMSFTSSLIADLGVDAPVTQSAFTYFSLALVYGGVLLYRRQRLRVAWYWYLLLGFVDVQGNFLVNKAYQFSSITSVTLLDCCTIAWAIVLTWLFLGTRYSLWQLLGAALCVLGLGLVLLSDAGGDGGGGSRPLLGDVLVIAGTIFFATSNVGEEFFVKKKDRVEVVCMIGVYGLLVSAVQLSILELKSLESVEWSTNILLGFAGYAASSFMFYTLAPFVLKVDWLYFLAFGIVVIGLIIYSTTEKDLNPMPDLENRISDLQYQILDNENVASTNEPSDS